MGVAGGVMTRHLIAVSYVVVLGVAIMPRTTPAWSATTCPVPPPASANLPRASDCDEGYLEEDEERLEEELEVREDEEEERAIAAERVAGEATDTAEEATKEAQEQTGQEETASHSAPAKATLKLQIRVMARRGHSPRSPGETRLSVATSIPAQVGIALRTYGRQARFFTGEATQGRKYVLRIPWACHTRASSYIFTVTVYRETDGQVDAGQAIVRRGAFTVDPRILCVVTGHHIS
jgi:hypothetical protein